MAACEIRTKTLYKSKVSLCVLFSFFIIIIIIIIITPFAFFIIIIIIIIIIIVVIIIVIIISECKIDQADFTDWMSLPLFNME